MDLKNHKQCNKCKIVYETSAFACMMANGERSDTSVEIYGNTYDLCPKCTAELYKFIHKSNTSLTVNIEEMEKIKDVLRKHNTYIISEIDGQGIHMGEIKNIALDANDSWIIETDIESISVTE